MKAITNAGDPDLRRFLFEGDGKLILWHGWADPGVPPEPTLDYYGQVVAENFDGDLEAARDRARLCISRARLLYGTRRWPERPAKLGTGEFLVPLKPWQGLPGRNTEPYAASGARRARMADN